jgi:putative heme iron utilization protein
MAERRDPVNPVDDEARSLARQLLSDARHAALAVIDAQTGSPGISRIAFGLDPASGPVTLISALSAHVAALKAHPACALMVGEPGARGDPLTHPRLMIQAEASFVAPDDPSRPALREHWLRSHPKARLYIDFADFAFVRLRPVSALLNGGFGRAWQLAPSDLVG